MAARLMELYFPATVAVDALQEQRLPAGSDPRLAARHFDAPDFLPVLLAELGPRYFEILLRWLGGKTLAQIGEATGLKPPTVHGHLKAIGERLRELVRQHEIGRTTAGVMWRMLVDRVERATSGEQPEARSRHHDDE